MIYISISVNGLNVYVYASADNYPVLCYPLLNYICMLHSNFYCYIVLDLELV